MMRSGGVRSAAVGAQLGGGARKKYVTRTTAQPARQTTEPGGSSPAGDTTALMEVSGWRATTGVLFMWSMPVSLSS